MSGKIIRKLWVKQNIVINAWGIEHHYCSPKCQYNRPRIPNPECTFFKKKLTKKCDIDGNIRHRLPKCIRIFGLLADEIE